MDAETDFLRSMKGAKELELWRSMRTTTDQNNGNPNAPSVQAILSQIELVFAEEAPPGEVQESSSNTSNSIVLEESRKTDFLTVPILFPFKFLSDSFLLPYSWIVARAGGF